MKVREVYLLQLSLIPAGNAKGWTTPPRRLALVSGKGWNLSKGKGNGEGGGEGRRQGREILTSRFFFFLSDKIFATRKILLSLKKGVKNFKKKKTFIHCLSGKKRKKQ